MRSRNRRAAEELEALLEGRLSSDEAGPEARRLAGVASTVVEERPGPVATLSDDRRLLMRDRLLDDIAALGSPPAETTPAAPARARRPVRAALATGLASTMLAATGVTVAAQEALPGDALYGLKKGTETVRMNLAADATQAARLELRFAEARLEEITDGATRLPSAALVDALAEMDERSLAGAQQLVLTAEQEGHEELLAEVDAFLDRQASGLVEVFDRLPIETRPHAEDSLAVLRRIRTDLLLPALEACDCLDIVPASHGGSEFVPRSTSDPLPPAAPQESPEQETSSGDSDPVDAEPADDGEPLSDLRPEDGTSGDDDGGLHDRLLDAAREAAETVDETADELDDTVEETTEELGETVEETADELEDTVDETTGTVGDLLDSDTSSLD